MSFLTRFIYYSDILGPELNFTFKGNSQLKTVFGGVLSILIMILGFILFCYFSIDLIQKRKPEIRLTNEEKEFSEIYLKDFPIVVGFINPQGIPINNIDSYITIYPNLIKFENVDGKANVTPYTLFMEKCDPDIHFAKHKDLFADKFTPVGNEICLNPTKIFLNSDYTLTSPYVDDKYASNSEVISFYNEYATIPSTYINLLIYKCNEKRDKKKCATDEEFRKVTKELYVILYIVDYYIDMQDFDNPNKSKIRTYTQMVGYEQPKRNYFRFKKAWINSDDGFLIENTNNNPINFYQFSNVKMDLMNSDIYFYGMSFEVETVNDIFYRRYEKIQDVLAKVGGIFKIISIVGNLLIYNYSKSKFYFDLTNRLYERSIEISQNNTQTLNDYNNFLRPAAKNNFNVIDTTKINREVKKEALKLTFGDYIQSILSKRAKYPYKLYELSKNIITSNFDISTYFKIIRNRDLFIDILTINEEEKNIFNCKSNLEEISIQKEFSSVKENHNEIIAQIKNRLRSNH